MDRNVAFVSQICTYTCTYFIKKSQATDDLTVVLRICLIYSTDGDARMPRLCEGFVGRTSSGKKLQQC